MKLVYVAGPYRSDPETNTLTALDVANQIWDLGAAPLVPHLTHYWHAHTPKPDSDWLQLDAEHLRRCDALYRIPGDSRGADAETWLAHGLPIPVFHNLQDLERWLP